MNNMRNTRYAVLLAVSLFVGVLAVLGMRADIERAKMRSEETMRHIANIHDSFAGQARAILVAISRIPEVKNGASTACDAILSNILQQSPIYTNFGMANERGDVLCSSVPLPRAVNITDRIYFQNAVKTKDFAIGEYQIGRITNQPVVVIGYPLQNGGVVFAGISLAWMNDFAKAEPGLVKSTLTLVDRTGTVLVRHPDSAQWVGNSIFGTPLFEAISQRNSGAVKAKDVDGTRRMLTFSPWADEEHSGAYIVVGAPADTLYPALHVIAACLSFLLALFALWRIVMRRAKGLRAK